MTTFSGFFDTKFTIYQVIGDGPIVGTRSQYAELAHPATDKLIEGWEFDSRIWPVGESDYTTVLPVLTNPDLSLIPEEDYASGIGSNEDLEVDHIEYLYTSGDMKQWSPVINHGYYYFHNHQNYLFADSYRTQYTSATDVTESGLSFINFEEFPKTGNPILAQQYIWDEFEAQYDIFRSWQKKAEFTGKLDPAGTNTRLPTFDYQREKVLFGNIDQNYYEFIVWYSGVNLLPIALFNQSANTVIGSSVTVSGDLNNLELLGITDGSQGQEFHTLYSPIDRTALLKVYTFPDSMTSWTEWTPIYSGLDLTGNQVRVDRDQGIVNFGFGANQPAGGLHVGIYYTTAVELRYEPQNTPNLIIPTESISDTNPIKKSVEKGFVLIANQEEIPYSIDLTSDLEEITNNLFGLLEIGNNLTKLTATVTTVDGDLIEGIPVTFNLLDDPIIGNFTNGSGTVRVITNVLGQAHTYYAPPNTIEEISELITISGYLSVPTTGPTYLSTEDLKVTETQRDIYLYKVWKDDPVQGIDLGDQDDLDAGIVTTELAEFYRQFFQDEQIFGPTGNVYPTTTATTGAPEWEDAHRIITGLLRPKNYNRLFRNGRKQLVSTYDLNAQSPHEDVLGAYVPLQPYDIIFGGDNESTVVFSGELDAPGTGDLDGYLLISPTTVSVRASTINPVTGATIYSNTIEIQLSIPAAMNGTLYLDTLNSIPSGLLSYDLSLLPNDDRILPLGWRLPSTGITYASALGGVTYIDINPEPDLSHYFVVVSGVS